MRLLLLLLATVAVAVQGWSIKLVPGGDHLKNRFVGKNAFVSCTVIDYDGPASDFQVNWIRNNEIIRSGRIMTIEKPFSSQLMIVMARKEDSADYTCQAKLGSETRHETASITFVKSPTFKNKEEHQHPVEGSTAEIKCEVDAEEGVEIFWQHKGITIEENSPRGYDFKDNKQTLVIPNFSAESDDGEYICNAAQFSSFVTLPINVTGYSGPTITVFDTPANETGYEGQSASFKCGAVGKPKPTYKWFKISTFRDDIGYERMKEDEELVTSDLYTVENGLLTINALSETSTGEYKCVATNDVGSDEKQAKINVHLKPKVDKLENVVKEDGQDIVFTCKYAADGKTTAKFTFKDDVYEVLPTDEPGHEGEEDEDDTTEESSTDGDHTGEVTEKEAEEEDEDDEEEGKEEKSKWRRFVRDVKTERISVEESDNKLTLTIKDLNADDAGEYMCVVTNEAGSTIRKAQLAITHAPTITDSSDEKTRSLDGEDFTLSCTADAVPDPKWTWHHNDDEVEADGSDIRITTDGLTSSITIVGNDVKDYGEYKCVADNGVGEAGEKSFQVVRILKPAALAPPSCTDHVFPTHAKCHFDGIEKNTAVEESEPTKITFYYAPEGDVDNSFDWKTQALNVTVEFERDVPLRIDGLATNSVYWVKAVAHNEAGESDISPMAKAETTDPWAPEQPDDIKIACKSACVLSWKEPDNQGSPIIGYKATFKKILDHDEEDDLYSEEIDDSSDAVTIKNLEPNHRYKVALTAKNAIGESDAAEVQFMTPEHLTSGLSLEQMASPTVMIAVGVIILFLLLSIDLACCLTNRCGITACICARCCGRKNEHIKGADLEKGPESGRLLDSR